MLRPLGLPPGSVRALLLLAFAVRAVFDLRETHTLPAWLTMALLLSAAAYFSGRSWASASEPVPGAESRRVRPPLGLPTGTVRTLFLFLVAYGAWVWLKDREFSAANVPVAWILLAFFLGTIVRWILRRFRRDEDEGTPAILHVEAIVAILCVGGLVALAATGKREGVDGWVEPLLAAAGVFYFGSR
jgi:hypothetical protein